MRSMRRYFGEWISVQAYAERTPPRLTITITFGELPEAWSRPRARARTWAALLGLVCISPFIALIAASLLRGAGITAPYDALSGSSLAILAATLSLFVGIPVAIVVNLWRITRIGVQRGDGALEGLVALELAPLHLVVVMIALAVAALFVGHLAADSLACLNGVRTAC
jgi:hypothetical protein